MEVQKDVQPKEEKPIEPTPQPEEEITYGEPRGAFVFVIAMMIFYVVYWAIHWYEIFVMRGA